MGERQSGAVVQDAGASLGALWFFYDCVDRAGIGEFGGVDGADEFAGGSLFVRADFDGELGVLFDGGFKFFLELIVGDGFLTNEKKGKVGADGDIEGALRVGSAGFGGLGIGEREAQRVLLALEGG